MSEYLTAAEVAAELRRSVDYVQRQCKTGNLRAKKLGTEWRITQAALAEFMDPSGGEPAPPTRVRLSARQQRRAS